jgi:hypothetical protein
MEEIEDDNLIALRMNKESIVTRLNFDEEYDDFMSFLNETKDPIYRAIYKAFNNLHNGVDTVKIIVHAHVDETKFESIFEYTKSDADVLMDLIIPYFEQKEDYEACAEIITIYNSFKEPLFVENPSTF